MKYPNIDLHCDLLLYMMRPDATIYNAEDIGCALPHLVKGNVKLQITAIYAPTAPKSTVYGLKQSEIFQQITQQNEVIYAFSETHLTEDLSGSSRLGFLAAIENASAFCEEDTSLDEGFHNLETILSNTGNILYIGITHHHENRFGGGNYSSAGLKPDGKVLIDYLAGKKIAIDLAHTSDFLAYDILNYIDQKNYTIPVLASHSNYRSVHLTPRNLPDDLVKEIVKREGLIGLNFVKDYIHATDADAICKHLAYGLQLGAENCISYGADYFYFKEHPDLSRHPFFFEHMKNATVYPFLNKSIEKIFSGETARKISHANVIHFLDKLWK